MNSLFFLFCLLVFVTLSLASGAPTTIPYSGTYISSYGSRHSIYYQNVNGSYPASYTFQSVVNPIQVYVNSAVEVAVCISYQENSFPVSGPNLYATCAPGAYAIFQNSTTLTPATSTKKSTRNSFVQRIVGGEEEEEDILPSLAATSGQYLNLYVKPSANASIILLNSSPSSTYFSFYITGTQCPIGLYPIGVNKACITIPTLPSTSFVIIPAGNPMFYQFTVNSLNNEFTILVESAINQFEVYLQNGYIPTSQWYLQKVHASLGTANVTVVSPYYASTSQHSGDANPNQYFVMILNNSPFDMSVNVTLRYSNCPNSSYFGPNCAYSSTLKIPNLSLPIGFAKSTNEDGYFYYQLLSYPNYATPYYIRVSVASTTPGVTAPPLYARRGSVPSRDANNYAVNTLTAVNQVLIRITSSDISTPITTTNAWYFALPAAHSNFEIWTGYNCANNCTQSGTCYCNGNNCYTETNGGRNLIPLYQRPYTVVDSGGVCECEYGSGFSCNSNSFSAITNTLVKLFDYFPFNGYN